MVQQAFTGDPASPQFGDPRITNAELFDERGTRVGTGRASCTIFSVPPLDTLEDRLLTAVFAEGQLIFGGVAPLAEVGAAAQFGIVGGTGGFRTGRGAASAVVAAAGTREVTFDLDSPAAQQTRAPLSRPEHISRSRGEAGTLDHLGS